jgi:hypothetical protein
MTDQVTGTPAVIAYAPKEKSTDSEAEIVDRAGNAILGLVSRAADAAAADLQEAREVAEKLADQLRAAHEQLQVAHDQLRAANGQINDLKADVRHYQDRADRAEKWLHQISSEIETKVFRRRRRRAGEDAAMSRKRVAISPIHGDGDEKSLRSVQRCRLPCSKSCQSDRVKAEPLTSQMRASRKCSVTALCCLMDGGAAYKTEINSPT